MRSTNLLTGLLTYLLTYLIEAISAKFDLDCLPLSRFSLARFWNGATKKRKI